MEADFSETKFNNFHTSTWVFEMVEMAPMFTVADQIAELGCVA